MPRELVLFKPDCVGSSIVINSGLGKLYEAGVSPSPRGGGGCSPGARQGGAGAREVPRADVRGFHTGGRRPVASMGLLQGVLQQVTSSLVAASSLPALLYC